MAQFASLPATRMSVERARRLLRGSSECLTVAGIDQLFQTIVMRFPARFGLARALHCGSTSAWRAFLTRWRVRGASALLFLVQLDCWQSLPPGDHDWFVFFCGARRALLDACLRQSGGLDDWGHPRMGWMAAHPWVVVGG